MVAPRRIDATVSDPGSADKTVIAVFPRSAARRSQESASVVRGRCYMFMSVGSCRMSEEIRTTGFLLVFCHQCDRPASTETSPALWTSGMAQVLAYSVISPDTT